MVYHHIFWWKFFPQKELNQIYISVALRNFALSLTSLFVPLYLYKELGFTLQQTLYFYLFYSIIFAITTPLAAKFSTRYGIKHSILLSVPLYIIYLLLLYMLPVFNTPLIIISTFMGLSIAFYWMGMHLVFQRASDHKHRGKEIGKREGISIIATLFGPLAGGFFIKFFGFKPLFIVTSIILFSSAGFLFLSKENHVRYTFSVRSITNKKYWKNSLFFVSRGTSVMATGVLWPLFIFTILNNYVSLGLVGSVLAGVGAILIIGTGYLSDHIDKRKIIRYITGFVSLSWFVRAFVTTVSHVFGATVFGAITMGINESPMAALEYDKARYNITEYFVNRELFICLGRILILTFVLMTGSIAGSFIFQGFMNLAVLLF
ncbi:hypothetical protein COV17_03400 [Candidatus Woesearchaeota archaeon CG10_big_fil_rev_8_21_14_0_10_36_11]|nr:MAG: hypothetical protein COV17_03400 [Candidatus Woesearchaeota archaeon CG10_big_fil_rev_8_21_14_0_10_36_11]